MMIPRAVSYNNKIYTTIGMIKLNNGAFLYAVNANDIISVDFVQIASLIKGVNFEIKKPTLVEYVFINFLTKQIQQKINNSEISSNQLVEVLSDVNKYVNNNTQLLTYLSQYDNQDEIVKENIQNLFINFSDAMSNNTYLKKQEVIVEKQTVESQVVQPEIKVEKNIVENPTYPPYDEMTITAILSNPQNNFDTNTFINLYLNDFNVNQIDLLLTNFKLNENQVNILNAKKQTMTVNEGKAQTNQSVQAKAKVFALPGRKERKESAFVDTLLLSFIVGSFCGIYLMYFVLTIMS